jgi:biotin transporter BioY
LAFPLAALAESLIAGGGSKFRDAAALATGFLVVFGLGITYLSLYFDAKGSADTLVVLLPGLMAWDAVKAGLALAVGRRLRVAVRGAPTSVRR